jgi:hypothetical protein
VSLPLSFRLLSVRSIPYCQLADAMLLPSLPLSLPLFFSFLVPSSFSPANAQKHPNAPQLGSVPRFSSSSTGEKFRAVVSPKRDAYEIAAEQERLRAQATMQGAGPGSRAAEEAGSFGLGMDFGLGPGVLPSRRGAGGGVEIHHPQHQQQRYHSPQHQLVSTPPTIHDSTSPNHFQSSFAPFSAIQSPSAEMTEYLPGQGGGLSEQITKMLSQQHGVVASPRGEAARGEGHPQLGGTGASRWAPQPVHHPYQPQPFEPSSYFQAPSQPQYAAYSAPSTSPFQHPAQQHHHQSTPPRRLGSYPSFSQLHQQYTQQAQPSHEHSPPAAFSLESLFPNGLLSNIAQQARTNANATNGSAGGASPASVQAGELVPQKGGESRRGRESSNGSGGSYGSGGNEGVETLGVSTGDRRQAEGGVATGHHITAEELCTQFQAIRFLHPGVFGQHTASSPPLPGSPEATSPLSALFPSAAAAASSHYHRTDSTDSLAGRGNGNGTVENGFLAQLGYGNGGVGMGGLAGLMGSTGGVGGLTGMAEFLGGFSGGLGGGINPVVVSSSRFAGWLVFGSRRELDADCSYSRCRRWIRLFRSTSSSTTSPSMDRARPTRRPSSTRLSSAVRPISPSPDRSEAPILTRLFRPLGSWEKNVDALTTEARCQVSSCSPVSRV